MFNVFIYGTPELKTIPFAVKRRISYMTDTFEYCGNIAMATGRANPKQAVTIAAWTGKWRRGYLLKNAVLENKSYLRLDDTLFSPCKANS